MLEDLELMRYVTIGQYLPTGSIVHRLDPRTKIVGLGLLIIVIATYRSATAMIVGLVLALGLVALARIPVGFALGGLRPALPILIFLAVLLLFFGWDTPAGSTCLPLWGWWILHITTCSLHSVVAMLARLATLVLLTSLLTLTTSTTELTHGLESLLRPLQSIGLPAHELAMSFTIALRFVPTLAEELEKLLKAQAARGGDIRLGKNPLQRTRHLLPVLVPLFLTTLRRGEALIEAMTARGYAGGAGRSHYIRLKLSPADALAAVLVVIVVVGLFLAPFQALDTAWLAFLHRIIG